jgi:hypothetical protein
MRAALDGFGLAGIVSGVSLQSFVRVTTLRL